MKLIRAVHYEDFRRDVFCHVCGSQFEVYAADIRAFPSTIDTETPLTYSFGFICEICSSVCILADRPLPPYVREAAERRAREPQQEANGDATQDG